MSGKSRKGKLFFSVILAVVMLIIVLPLSINVSRMKISKFKGYMGDSQILLLRTYERGEKFLYYIDQSAKLALKETVYSYLEKTNEENGCGEYFGYAKWTTASKTCYPEIKKDILTLFSTNFKSYLASYPELSEITYDILLAKEGKSSKIIGLAKEDIRIAVAESDDYSFVLEEKKEEEEEEEPTTPTPTNPTPSSGKCSFVADYAKKYVDYRCKYSYPAAPLATPETCNIKGLTCATFVSSVTAIMLGEGTSGNGNGQCSSPTVTRIGINPSVLQPGDVFSSEVYYNGVFTPWGHTGMYIGRGYLVPESRGEGNFCWRQYVPNPNGDYIFAHSIGYAGQTVPGVCYDTYNHLFVNTIFKLTSFCRPNKCI